MNDDACTGIGPCGCPCDACVNYCEQCPAACADGHTYTDGCRLGGEHERELDEALEDYHHITPEAAAAIARALLDPCRPTRTLPPRTDTWDTCHCSRFDGGHYPQCPEAGP